MSISLRACVSFLALTLVLNGFVFGCPQSIREMGLDVWNHVALDRELQEAVNRRAELDEISERLNRRLSMKTTVAWDLIEGRISMSHAAESFMTLNRVEPELMVATRIVHPANSDEASAALQVVAFVNCLLSDQSSRHREVIDRLERELVEMREN